jgi:hypothetical protein
LSSETLAEVEQKDIYVRLQEIFRDRKVALDQSLANIEQHYEHIVQVLFHSHLIDLLIQPNDIHPDL